jgi:SAM-dependent methyltransferase
MKKYMPLKRSLKTELLDQPNIDQQALAANLLDLRYADMLIGATRLVWRTLQPMLRELADAAPTRDFASKPHIAPFPIHATHPPIHATHPPIHATQDLASLLDVATGGADTPHILAQLALRAGYVLYTYASDQLLDALIWARVRIGMPRTTSMASVRQKPVVPLLVHDALHAPFGDASFDFATCSLALHHFTPAEAAQLLQELARITRHAAIIVDLRRTWLGYLGACLMALGPWDTMARHDGPLSVLRAYTPAEVRTIARSAGVQAEVHSVGPLLMRVVVRSKQWSM